MLPAEGDILVSNTTATVDYEVSIVPKEPHLSCVGHDNAVAKGKALAEELGVDAWLTEDHIHFIQIGTCRTDRAQSL